MSQENTPKAVVCPVEGCNYDGLPKSVAAHYSGKRAESGHEGGYNDIYPQLAQEAGVGSERQQEQNTGESGEATVSSNPFDSGNQSADGGKTETELPGCPECGAKPDMSPGDLEAGAVYVCDNCGEMLKWDPDND